VGSPSAPFREGELYYEGSLRREDGGTSKGAFGRAVRTITESEYEVIVKAGFVQTLGETALDASVIKGASLTAARRDRGAARGQRRGQNYDPRASQMQSQIAKIRKIPYSSSSIGLHENGVDVFLH
jgi:hypothetical protein